jgi:hypothetical protein
MFSSKKSLVLLAGALLLQSAGASADTGIKLRCDFRTAGSGKLTIRVAGNLVKSNVAISQGLIVARKGLQTYTIKTAKKTSRSIRVVAVAQPRGAKGTKGYDEDTASGDFDRVELYLDQVNSYRDRLVFKVRGSEVNFHELYCDI